MAHEPGHIHDRDTLAMTMTITGGISILAGFCLFLGHRAARWPNLLSGLAAVIVAPFAATITQMALGRTREYGAGRADAEISGKPRPLAKLAEGAGRLPDPMTARNPAAAALRIVPALSGHGGGGLFATHPDTASRIAASPPRRTQSRASASVPRSRAAPARRASALAPLGQRRRAAGVRAGLVPPRKSGRRSVGRRCRGRRRF